MLITVAFLAPDVWVYYLSCKAFVLIGDAAARQTKAEQMKSNCFTDISALLPFLFLSFPDLVWSGSFISFFFLSVE